MFDFLKWDEKLSSLEVKKKRSVTRTMLLVADYGSTRYISLPKWGDIWDNTSTSTTINIILLVILLLLLLASKYDSTIVLLITTIWSNNNFVKTLSNFYQPIILVGSVKKGSRRWKMVGRNSIELMWTVQNKPRRTVKRPAGLIRAIMLKPSFTLVERVICTDGHPSLLLDCSIFNWITCIGSIVTC